MKKINNEFKYNIFLGSNFKKDLSVLLEKLKIRNKNILLFVGKNYFIKSYNYQIFIDLQRDNYNEILDKIVIDENPKEIDIIEYVKKYENIYDIVIISIGGGSVTDAAKLFNHISNKKYIHCSILTNFGAGTCYSPFVIYDNDEFKIGLFDEKIKPKLIYYNINILRDVPKNLKINGIIDIFTHSLESFLSKSSDNIIKNYSTESMKYLKKYIDSDFENALFIIKSEIYSIESEKVGLVLFPHAAGHYLTYKKGIKHPLATYFYLESFLDYLQNNDIEFPDIFLEIFNFIKFNINNNYYFTWTEDDNQNSIELINKYMPFIFSNSPIKFNNDDYLYLINESNKKWKKIN